MVKKIFLPKILLIFCVMSSGAMLKGMDLIFGIISKASPVIQSVSENEFVKSNARHFLKIGAGLGLYGAYRLVLSRFDDLEKLMREVRRDVQLNGEGIGENGEKIEQLLKEIQKLPTKVQMAKLLELKKSEILKGQMEGFVQFEQSVQVELKALKKDIKGIQGRLKNVQEQGAETNEIVRRNQLLLLKNHQDQSGRLLEPNFTSTDVGLPHCYGLFIKKKPSEIEF